MKKNILLTINMFATWRCCESEVEFNPKSLLSLLFRAKYILKYKTLLNIMKNKHKTKVVLFYKVKCPIIYLHIRHKLVWVISKSTVIGPYDTNYQCVPKRQQQECVTERNTPYWANKCICSSGSFYQVMLDWITYRRKSFQGDEGYSSKWTDQEHVTRGSTIIGKLFFKGLVW